MTGTMHNTVAAPPSLAVKIGGVRREFDGGVVAIQGIDLEVPGGQFAAILGPSGCGKSTLLRLVAGLDRPDAGTVRLDGGDGFSTGNGADGRMRGHRGIAYVFQDAHLLPWRTVLSNVALPLELMGVPRRERLEAAVRAIEQVGLADAAGRYPAALSGGMRMRASLARALVTDPLLLLLDEPFAALDEITRQRLDEQLLELWQRRGMTVLFVTHSTSEAAFLAQRAVVLSARPARIVADHSVNLPAERTAQLRSEPDFAREVRILSDALRRGGA